MINKELDEIMCDYVDKAGKFCKAYEKAILSREHNIFSLELEKIYSNFESELWRMKHDTEELLYISNDRLVCRAVERQQKDLISHNMDEVKNELDSIQHDLNSAHVYFLNKCGANIAEGLAKKWHENAFNAGFEVLKSGIKAGAKNDNWFNRRIQDTLCIEI